MPDFPTIPDFEATAAILLASDHAGARRVGKGFRDWLHGKAEELSEALGVGRPGSRSLRTRRALEQRDELLREARARFYPALSERQAAREIAAALLRYRETRWRRGDCAATSCPARLDGTIFSMCWHVLRIDDRPLSARSIRRALGHELSEHGPHRRALSGPDDSETSK